MPERCLSAVESGGLRLAASMAWLAHRVEPAEGGTKTFNTLDRLILGVGEEVLDHGILGVGEEVWHADRRIRAKRQTGARGKGRGVREDRERKG